MAMKKDNTAEQAGEKKGDEWFDQWWAEQSQFRSPGDSGECQATSLSFDGFLGSQIFKDLKIISAHRTPLVRYVDIARCPYTKASVEPREGDSASLAGLRSCLKGHEHDNAMGCLFSPLSTCSAARPAAGDAGLFGAAPEYGREAALCADADCLARLKQPVPVEPQLEGGTGAPDVSWLALKLFSRLTAPAPDLERVVDEEVAKFRSANPESTGHCVAMHVRRGDKLPECAQGKESSCAFHKSLDEYLAPATAFLDQLEEEGPTPGYIFVMTDDDSLLAENPTAPNGARIVGLAGATPSQFEATDGVQNLVTLLASLKIGSACDAVVGNSESEVTELLVLANCAARGSCPSVHSMNGRPLQAFEGVIVDGRASTVNERFKDFPSQ